MASEKSLRTIARSGLRTMHTSIGQLSAPLRIEPTFIIAGAQRCATTSLYRMLSQHPDVNGPAMNKGIHYFDTASRFKNGMKFYRGHFPMIRPGGTSRKITGEGSPYYMFHPLAIPRIAASLPQAKIIIMLRDPVERAFSAYKQERTRGFENMTFDDALAAEERRLEGEEQRIITDESYQSFSHQHHAYVSRGRYAAQLERAFAAMGRENVLVIDADDFLAPGLPQWSALTNYLGISAWGPEDVLHSNSRPSEKMPDKTRAWLEQQFTDDDEKLEVLLGAKPSWRR